MTESFLHYIWQFQYYNKEHLLTSAGESILVLHPGHRNTHAGPDFFNAKVKIGNIEWVGSVEIHIFASGWREHKHEQDAAYENVVLHVVWDEDEKLVRKDGSGLPTLVLKKRVSDQMLFRYNKLINHPDKIPCASSINQVSDITRLSMLDKAFMMRLESKSDVIFTMLKRYRDDWEEVCYQMLAKNFGFKVNSDPLLQLAQSIPYKTLLKHADKPLQVEAMLFGQAGFLEGEANEEYYTLLRREYHILSAKYSLRAKQMNKAQWRFLRLRPANFPTLRIAQLAAVLCQTKNVFSLIIEAEDVASVMKLFLVSPSAYWKNHYQFFKQQSEDVSPMGKSSIENIVINTIAPILVAYGKAKDEQIYIDRAIQLLQGISAEENTILRSWNELGWKSKTAFDSQALIELHNNFCLRRRCLECNIGFSLLHAGES